MTTRGIPMPLEWHPFYRDKTWLMDWLEGRGTYSDDTIVIPLPVRPVPKFFEPDNSPGMAWEMRRITLTKHKAWGPAPWTDRSFVYVWSFATDELGRAIAGESHIVYRDGLP